MGIPNPRHLSVRPELLPEPECRPAETVGRESCRESGMRSGQCIIAASRREHSATQRSGARWLGRKAWQLGIDRCTTQRLRASQLRWGQPSVSPGDLSLHVWSGICRTITLSQPDNPRHIERPCDHRQRIQNEAGDTERCRGTLPMILKHIHEGSQSQKIFQANSTVNR